MNEKTRDLSIYEFCEVLQLEYLCAELRSKIYPHKNDKIYYKERVMPGKKRKIDDIVQRNGGFTTIFNNDQIRDTLYKKIVPDFGFPNFMYKDEEQRAKFESTDFAHYYMIGSDFLVKTDESGSKEPCTLVSVDKKNWLGKVKLRFKEDKKVVSLNNISRVI